MRLYQSLKQWLKNISGNNQPEPPSHKHDDSGDDFGNCCMSESEEAEHRAWLARVQERLRVINEREREKESKT